MIRLTARIAVASAAMLCTFAQAQDPFYRHAADCATAHQARLMDILEKQLSPSDADRKRMVSEVELGLSFAGTAYKNGLRGPLLTIF